MSEDKVTISISKNLYLMAEKFIKENGGFSSVEELIEFVLSNALEGEEEDVYSEEDKKKIEERLRDLGYI